jgi:hypothetical protein
MRRILSEKNLVVILFVMVLITFAFAHEDTKKMEKIYIGVTSSATSNFVSLQPLIKTLQADAKDQPAANRPE